jgi:hypothetical protein
MTITMLEFNYMKDKYERKKIPGKGDRKLRDCLGTCGKKFVTTPDTRICAKCKRRNEERDDSDPFSVNFWSNWKNE